MFSWTETFDMDFQPGDMRACPRPGGVLEFDVRSEKAFWFGETWVSKRERRNEDSMTMRIFKVVNVDE